MTSDDKAVAGGITWKGALEGHGIFLILASISFQALAGIMAKYAALSAQPSLASAVVNAYYVLSLLCLALQALAWQQVLKRYELSAAYPLTSLVNFVVLLSSLLLFNESLRIANIAGLALISAGLTFMARGGR